MKKEKRKSGISVVGDVPWGTHLCQFYKTKEDLLDILIPYFKTGLENNEFCMWVTSEPLNVEEAKTALGKVVKNLDDYIKKGQIEILDYRSWYVKSRKFDSDRVLKGWVEKEKYALQNGFDGLRLNGNTFWLVKNDWDDFKGYEETVNDVIDKHRMIAICSYSLEKCNASEIIDVVSNHQFAIIRRESKWNIIESSERKKAERQIKNSEERYRNLIELAPDSIVTVDLKGYITSCNSAATRIFRYSKDDLIGKHFLKIGFFHVKDIPNYLKVFVSVLRGKGKGIYELTVKDKDEASRIVETHIDLIKENNKISGVIAITCDITERKKAQEKIKRLTKFPSENPNPVLRIKKNGEAVYSNKAGLQILDFWKTNIGEEVPERWRNIIRKKLASKNLKAEEEEEEEELNDKIFSFVISPVADEGYVNLYGRDITEHKQAEESLRFDSEILANLTEGINLVRVDDGIIIYTNRQFEKMFGYDSGELIKKHISIVNAPSNISPEETAKVIMESLNKNGVWRGEIYNIKKDGTPFWCYANVSKFTHTDYGPVWISVHQDITERKRAEEALKQSEEKYRILFNDVPVGIGITDEGGRIVDCNQCMAEMFRITYEEFKAINVKSLYVNPKDRKRFLNLLNKEGKVIDWECSFKRKDGTAFFAILNTDVIEMEGQKLNLTTLRDITERKVAEEKIKNQNVQLKKLDSVKTDFLNTTSHELRTPVASIKGYIQMLLKQTLGEITEEQKKALEVLLRNTNRLDHLIQDILDISRLESGTMKFITEKTDATKMIKEVVETMQTSADLKRIKINIGIQKEIPDLMIDQERMKQVLTNLVDNAIKFSPDGSMIHIKARKEKKDVLFEVQDFGRGIPKNKQKKIFERFYQVDAGMDRKFGGVGLGLTISQGIIHAHGGKIWVDSMLDKGSTFKFSLPSQSVKDAENRFKKEIDIFELEK